MAGDDELPYHIPVLCPEAIDLLLTNPDGVYVDGTLGGGGHSAALLARLGPAARVIGVDQDPEAIAFSKRRFRDDGRMTVIHSNIIQLRSILHDHDIRQMTGILLDLGMSSRHVDMPGRGFSFQHDGPLDMRMNTAGTTTAEDLVRDLPYDDLSRVFSMYGEERRSRRIAAAIVAAREAAPITSTRMLAGIVGRCAPPQQRSKTLARIFQALRIAVNDELETLRSVLAEALDLLCVEGRMLAISYHSLEDGIVKRFFAFQQAPCTCPPKFPRCVCGAIPRIHTLTRHALKPDENEIRRNPRARSARLRAGEKVHA